MKLSDLARACAQYVTERRGDCEVLLPCMDSRKKTERGAVLLHFRRAL